MAEFSTSQITSMLTQQPTSGKRNSWFEEMADAWGTALNAQATRIVEQADKVSGGLDTPAEITELTAESLRMNFISNSSHTSLTSVGSALETLARKQ
jgi:hypothetical protein